MQSVLLREYLLVLQRLELMLESWLRRGLRLRRILLMAVLSLLLGQELLLLVPSRSGIDVVCHFICCLRQIVALLPFLVGLLINIAPLKTLIIFIPD